MKYIIFVFCLILISGCSNDSTEPEELQPALFFSQSYTSITVGGQANLSLEIQNLTESVFGVSFQMQYDSSIVSFNESSGMSSGDFFGQDAIVFVKDNDTNIHITIAQIQGQSEVSGSGIFSTFTFIGKLTGNCTIEIIPEDLHFYDVNGNIVELQDLAFESATIIVQ